MSSSLLNFIVHPFSRGLDLSSSITAIVPGGTVAAENCEYGVHLSPEGARLSYKKRLGTSRYNATQLVVTGAGGDTFTALGDFWRFGSSLTATQKFVATAGTAIYKDDGDGVWDSIKSSWGTNGNTETNIVIAQGYAVFSNGVDTPQKWDQTTVTDLGTSAPTFTDATYHLRRLFEVGDPTSPSRVRFTAAADITDHTGGDSSTFFIGDDDRDRVIGVSEPFHGRLYFFKGPNYGSVWELAGRTAATFTQDHLFSGAPCVSHRGIITTPTDIYWASLYGIHQLTTTQKYGDTEENFLSRPIQTLYNTINFARAAQIVGFYHPNRNLIGWVVPTGSNTQNDTVLAYNYAVNEWSTWTLAGFKGASVMVGRTPTTGRPRLYIGGYDGRARAGDQTTLGDDNGNEAYTMRVKTPYHLRFDENTNELTAKNTMTVTSIVRPTGNFNANLTVITGSQSHTGTVSLNPGSGDLIGSTFIIGTSLIGSGAKTAIGENVIDGAGLGRGVQIEWTQGGLNQDFELYGYGVRYQRGNDVPMDVNQ